MSKGHVTVFHDVYWFNSIGATGNKRLVLHEKKSSALREKISFFFPLGA